MLEAVDLLPNCYHTYLNVQAKQVVVCRYALAGKDHTAETKTQAKTYPATLKLTGTHKLTEIPRCYCQHQMHATTEDHSANQALHAISSMDR